MKRLIVLLLICCGFGRLNADVSWADQLEFLESEQDYCLRSFTEEKDLFQQGVTAVSALEGSPVTDLLFTKFQTFLHADAATQSSVLYFVNHVRDDSLTKAQMSLYPLDRKVLADYGKALKNCRGKTGFDKLQYVYEYLRRAQFIFNSYQNKLVSIDYVAELPLHPVESQLRSKINDLKISFMGYVDGLAAIVAGGWYRWADGNPHYQAIVNAGVSKELAIRDWYKDLGIAHDASLQEVQRQSRKAVFPMHPDKVKAVISDKQKTILERMNLPTSGASVATLITNGFKILDPEAACLKNVAIRRVYDENYPKIKKHVWRYYAQEIINFLDANISTNEASDGYQALVKMEQGKFSLTNAPFSVVRRKTIRYGINEIFSYFDVDYHKGVTSLAERYFQLKALFEIVFQGLESFPLAIPLMQEIESFVQKYLEILEQYQLLFASDASSGAAETDGDTEAKDAWKRLTDATVALAAKALTGLSSIEARAFTNIQTKAPAQLQAFIDGSMTSVRANALWAMWKNYQLYLYNDELVEWAKTYIDLMYDWLKEKIGVAAIDTSRLKTTPADMQHACEKLNELRERCRVQWDRIDMPETAPVGHRTAWSDIKNILMSTLPVWLNAVHSCTMTLKDVQGHYRLIEQVVGKADLYLSRAPYTDLDGDGNSIFEKMQPAIYFLKQQVMPLFLAYYHMLNDNAYVLPPLAMYTKPAPSSTPGDMKITNLLTDLSQALSLIRV